MQLIVIKHRVECPHKCHSHIYDNRCWQQDVITQKREREARSFTTSRKCVPAVHPPSLLFIPAAFYSSLETLSRCETSLPPDYYYLQITVVLLSAVVKYPH